MGKFKKIMMAVLAAVMIFTMSVIPAAAEDGAGESAGADPLYIYRYDGLRWNNGTRDLESVYKLAFKWMRTKADGTHTELEKWRTYPISSGIFRIDRIDGKEESFAAYCCDFIMTAETGSLYKRINLEDASYFSDGAAMHIRGIMNHGYWTDWTQADLAAAEKAANEWLASDHGDVSLETGAFLPGDAFDEVGPISGLTDDQAMTATQLAIWAFANTEGDGLWMKFRPYEEGADEDAPLILDNNIKAFRQYLLGQLSQAPTPEGIIFTDEAADVYAVFSSSGDISYNLTLRFRLAADIDGENDDLMLRAALGEKVTERPLTGTEAMEPDGDGYYTMNFEGVEAPGTINLEITGTQTVNDVYFYEAEQVEGSSARYSSQNLVGFAEGQTPVRAQSELSFTLGTGEVSLFKRDSETGEPLAGAEFSLYAYDGKVYHPVKTKLTTDDSGLILVSGLTSGYDYYFMETKAPAGYEADNTGYIKAELHEADETVKAPVTVYNTEKEKPVIPVVPVIPTEPVIPVVPVTPVVPEVPDEPETPEIPETPEEPEIPETPEEPQKPDPAETPETGDSSPLPYMLAMAAAAAGIAALNKKNRQH